MSAGEAGVAGFHVEGTQMAELWWVPALALHERGVAPLPVAGATDGGGTSTEVAQRWRAGYGAEGLAGWLADIGLDEARMAGVLAESPESVAGRVVRLGPRLTWD